MLIVRSGWPGHGATTWFCRMTVIPGGSGIPAPVPGVSGVTNEKAWPRVIARTFSMRIVPRGASVSPKTPPAWMLPPRMVKSMSLAAHAAPPPDRAWTGGV
jgi:hypothetical protein